VQADGVHAPSEPAATVDQLVDNARLGPLHWRVLLLCALVLMLDGYDLAAMGIALPAIAKALAIPPASFGPALSALFVGVAIGSLVAGPMGDRYGRRPTILACFVLGGVAALATATATSVTEFELWRFVTGIGMGGVTPNAVALLSEYMPQRRRAFLVVAAFSSAAFGSFVGGLSSAWLLPRFGWQAAFVLGGAGPLLVSLLAFLRLPESLFFLVNRRRMEQAAALASELAPGRDTSRSTLAVRGDGGTRPSVTELFAGPRRVATLLIWLLFIGTQALVFFMGSWLATLLTQTGMAMSRAVIALSIFHLGSFVVGLLAAWQSDRRSPEKMLALTYVTAAAAVGLLAAGGTRGDIAYPLCFIAGGGVVGASFCLGALASSYYPPKVRAMGLGWGLAVGRIGSVTSPLLGGLALGAGWSVESILAAATIPAVVCTGAVLALLGIRPRVFRMLDAT
jgi:AAHS family 4-hydroxybenzoate transporter-like MFS transporter